MMLQYIYPIFNGQECKTKIFKNYTKIKLYWIKLLMEKKSHKSNLTILIKNYQLVNKC